MKIDINTVRRLRTLEVNDDTDKMEYLYSAIGYGRELNYDTLYEHMWRIMREHGDTMESVADKLNLSSRTIRRYLEQESQGINFELAVYIIHNLSIRELEELFEH